MKDKQIISILRNRFEAMKGKSFYIYSLSKGCIDLEGLSLNDVFYKYTQLNIFSEYVFLGIHGARMIDKDVLSLHRDEEGDLILKVYDRNGNIAYQGIYEY